MSLKKYLKFYTSGVETSFEYRGALLTWLVVELISVSSALFLWLAVFRSTAQVGLFGLGSMLLYFALIPFFGSFTNSFVSDFLPREIKDGVISKDLIKPYSLKWVILARQLAIKSTQLILRMPAYIGVLIFLSVALKVEVPVSKILFAVLFAPFCFFVHFFLDFFFALFAFFMDDAWSLSHLKFILILIFGGMTFPLSLVPYPLKYLFDFSPFKFLYYFPANLAINGITNVSSFAKDIFLGLFWILLFWIFGNILWKKGVRKFEAYGN